MHVLCFKLFTLAPFLISSSLIAVTTINMPMTPNCVSLAQSSLPNPKLMYLTVYSISRNIWESSWHLWLNMLRIELIFSTKPAQPAPFPISVDGNCNLPVAYNKSLETFFFLYQKKITRVLIIQLQQLPTNAQPISLSTSPKWLFLSKSQASHNFLHKYWYVYF